MAEDFVALPLKFARPGLTIEQNVLDRAGRLIIAKGTRLTPMLLSRLVKWNIAEIFIPTAEAEALRAASPEVRDAPEAVSRSPEASVRPPTRTVAVGDLLSGESAQLAVEVERELNARFHRMLDRPLMAALREAAWTQLVNPEIQRRLPGRR